MPRWIGPVLIGIAACVASIEVLSMLLDEVGVPSFHEIAFFDADGDHQEGGSTRAGFMATMVSLGIGIWAGIAFHTRRLDAGWDAAEWRTLIFGLAALTAYTIIMTLLTVTYESETRAIPDFLFNVLDLLVLAGAGWAAIRMHRASEGK